MYQRPAVPSRPELWTFQDALERLIEVHGEGARDSGRQENLLRESILAAYRDIPKYHPWKYFKRASGFSSEASYSTGTIAYSNSTNKMTLSGTGAAWPANAEFGMVKVGRDHWPVYNRESDTIVEMDGDWNPPEDIAAGTSYEWYRDSYPFPGLTRKLGRLLGGDNYFELPYTDPEHAMAIARSRSAGTINWPELYTVRNDKRYYNNLSIVLIPPPNSIVSYMYLDHPSGQPLTTEKYSTGTATVDGAPTATTTVTFAGGASLDSALHVGCVLRLSSDGTTEPTTVKGGLAGINPYAVQRVIVSVTDSTTCTVDSSISADYSAVKYTISSPLDLEYGSMLSCFWSLCEWEYAKNCQLDGKRIGQSEHRFKQDLAFAQAEDSRATHVDDAMMRIGYSPYWLPVGDVSVT